MLVSLVQGFGVRWAHSSLGTQNALYIANFMGLVMCVFVGLATEGWMVFVALALTMPQYVLMPTLRAAISQVGCHNCLLIPLSFPAFSSLS